MEIHPIAPPSAATVEHRKFLAVSPRLASSSKVATGPPERASHPGNETNSHDPHQVLDCVHAYIYIHIHIHIHTYVAHTQIGSLINVSAKIFHTLLMVSRHAGMGSRRNRVVQYACSTVGENSGLELALIQWMSRM